MPAPRTDRYDFVNIKAFTFGERYSVLLRSGVTIDFDDLETCLGVMATEFEAKPGYQPGIVITSTDDVKRAAFGQSKRVDSIVQGAQTTSVLGDAAGRVLAVVPVVMSGAFPRPPLEYYTDQVVQAVTIYNLTQSWDQYSQANL